MSPLWTGEALARATGGVWSGQAMDAGGVSIDSRTLVAGDVFVALVGDNGDGHGHVAAALDRGAAAALVHASAPLPSPCTETRLLRVADTQAALVDLARFARARFDGRLVAVTGSVGKTTTKEMLRTALAALGPTHAAAASHNNHWGVPLTLSRLPPDAAFCVSELGMNHPGEIAPLARLANPDVAVITTIGASHIGQMGSLAAIAREKGDAVRSLRPGGTAVIPYGAEGMEALAREARAAGLRVIRFGGPNLGELDLGEPSLGKRGSDAEARITALSMGADGSQMTLEIAGVVVDMRLAAPGRHMAMNALACLAAVSALGGDIRPAADALAGFSAGDGRGALRPLLGGRAWLLDESYNASQVSVRAALERMRLTPATRRVVVLGDMLELGDFAVEQHESLQSCVRESADIVYCCGTMMTRLFNLLPETLQGARAGDAAMLAPLVAAALRPGDLVLVKGSHGSRMRDVVAALAAA